MTDNQVSEPRKDTAANIKLTSKQGKAALRELLAPVQLALRVGRVMAVISAILRVFPFVALVGIGNELLTSLGKGASPNQRVIIFWVQVLIGTCCGGLFAYFVGLLVTHIADNRLSASIRCV